jgi:hypothetical protein
MWRAFGQVLLDVAAGTDEGDSRKTTDEIVAGATDTFDSLCQWFSSLARLRPSP